MEFEPVQIDEAGARKPLTFNVQVSGNNVVRLKRVSGCEYQPGFRLGN